MAMNMPPEGGMPGGMAGGPAGGGQQQQIVNRLRQMDHEELVMLALQLIMRLQEIEMQMQGQAGGGQPPMG